MKEKKRLPFPLHIGVEPKVLSDCALFPPGVPYYPTQDQYQSSGPIILSSALQQQAPPPQYALPQQRRRECQQTVVAVQTDDESTPPTATVVIPPAAASTPPPPSKVPELVVPSKLTTEPNLSQGLQLASPLSTVPVGQDSDFGASASPPPPLTDLPPADIPALEPKMGESMDAPLVSEAVPQAEKEPVEAPLEPEPPVSRSSQCQRKSPRKIITSVSFSNDIQLNKAEKAWRPSMKKVRAHKAEADEENLEVAKTLDLLRRVRSILNKLTPQMFQPLMKQLTELSMDTEERLKGVVDLVYEKAISEPKFSVTYAKLCRCLMMLKVPTSDKSGGTVNFGRLLLNCCQKEFAKDKDSNERKQKELEAASEGMPACLRPFLPPTISADKPSSFLVKSSTSELLTCLGEFLCRRSCLLKDLSAHEPLQCVRSVDRSLTLTGWQQQGFFTPGTVVFLYMLCRDIVSAEVATKEELQAVLLTGLYVSFSFDCHEISYPDKPFLLEENRGAFWTRTLEIVNRMSGKMLHINNNLQYFGQIFNDLKNRVDN
ncbi:uncharacterized protein LOC143527886 [Brachyhypopomus gauderio]|uniref:uncharacterized protein LOC143527886 n=1 Tax=Brachyhypopomus gauderio TaxID=698409 RepID=UPI00404140F8